MKPVNLDSNLKSLFSFSVANFQPRSSSIYIFSISCVSLNYSRHFIALPVVNIGYETKASPSAYPFPSSAFSSDIIACKYSRIFFHLCRMYRPASISRLLCRQRKHIRVDFNKTFGRTLITGRASISSLRFVFAIFTNRNSSRQSVTVVTLLGCSVCPGRAAMR